MIGTPGLVQAATLFSVPTWFRAQPNPSLELWSTLTEDSLSDWVVTTAHVVSTSPTAAAPPMPTPSFSVEESKHTRSQVHAFQMQIKQTPGDFHTFKEDKGWFQWHRLTIAIAAAQGVSEPLDKDYYPEPDTDEELLFKEKQTYLYSVFVLKIQTSFGKASVC